MATKKTAFIKSRKKAKKKVAKKGRSKKARVILNPPGKPKPPKK
jgi:hypothetical protein